MDAAIIGGIASGLEALEPSQGELLACVFCIVVLLGSGLGALFLVAGMFKDAMSGRPPFSPKQVRRLNIIGALLLCNAVFGIIWHVVCMFGPLASRGVALAVTPDWLALWAIDILLIVAAIVSFYLSRAFKFAHLLQSFYDESV